MVILDVLIHLPVLRSHRSKPTFTSIPGIIELSPHMQNCCSDFTFNCIPGVIEVSLHLHEESCISFQN